MAAPLDDSRSRPRNRSRPKADDSDVEGTMEETATIEVYEGADEDRLVHEWRTGQLERLGIPGWLAEIFADRIDWHEIAALVERACSPRLALEIVR